MTLYTDLCCLRVDCIVKGKNKNSILFCTNLGTLLRKFVVLWVVSDWQMNWVCWYFVKYQINQNQISDSVTPLTIKAAMKCPSKRLTQQTFSGSHCIAFHTAICSVKDLGTFIFQVLHSYFFLFVGVTVAEGSVLLLALLPCFYLPCNMSLRYVTEQMYVRRHRNLRNVTLTIIIIHLYI